MLAGMLAARAHDPYQIISVAYLHSNRTELVMEMEFPTAMKLAGIEPAREAAAVSQFEGALPQLRAAAGAFFQFTAGNQTVVAQRTNVELVVENHIRFQLQFAPTPFQPLRFAAPGLRALAELGPYGASLTVLDLVHQKVVGQSTLFADSPAAEFTPLPQVTKPAAAAPASAVVQTPAPPQAATVEADSALPSAAAPRRRSNFIALFLIAGFFAMGWLVRRRR